MNETYNPHSEERPDLKKDVKPSGLLKKVGIISGITVLSLGVLGTGIYKGLEYAGRLVGEHSECLTDLDSLESLFDK